MLLITMLDIIFIDSQYKMDEIGEYKESITFFSRNLKIQGTCCSYERTSLAAIQIYD